MRVVLTLSVALITIAGCTPVGTRSSGIMQSYVGKDVAEAAMDYGPPTGTMDLPDGTRAFLWKMSGTKVIPRTTTYNASGYGDWVTGSATTYGGGVSNWQCNYTLIGQKNAQKSYTIVGFRKPIASC